MQTLIFAGSKGGASRTTSSLLFAAGATELGRNPLHIQILLGNRWSALKRVTGIPFATRSIDVSEQTSIMLTVRGCAAEHPGCDPIVVDLPAGWFHREFVAERGVEILLPTRNGSLEIELAVRDYRDAQAEEELRGQHISEPLLPSTRFLPVGWPSDHVAEDFRAALGQRGLTSTSLNPVPIVLPGIPALDPLDIDLLSGGPAFELTQPVQIAARQLARAILAIPETRR